MSTIVLVHVNNIRHAAELEPLSRLVAGIQTKVWECALARSLNHGSSRRISVDACRISTPDKTFAEIIAREFGVSIIEDAEAGIFGIPTPDLLVDFIADFDEGAYPELVATS